ncbi:MAG: hypothetical protein OXP66_08190 [Candidatus Tectomicrobia bacterium]|nr:hypothetical protein [Candidatus Tectomicrobia bacterium]
MRWPWQRQTENRASFTDAIVAALYAGAAGTGTRDALATAALEAVSSLYAGAFARAKLEPAVPAVTPATLALIARDLIRRGESLHLIETAGGELMLRPVGSWDIRGGVDPASWWARCDLFGPSGNVTRLVPHRAVVHCRYSMDPSRPWLGVGPLQWAESTGALAGRLETGLADEAGANPAQLLPVPQNPGGGDDDPVGELKSNIAAKRGKVQFVETVAAGWGEGKSAAPLRDWEQKRIGADWPDVLRATRAEVFRDVAAACNLPAVLLDARAEGTSQREALRRWVHLAVEPLGEIVAAELAAKLDRPGLALSFAPLMASDLAGKARAIKGLVEAGLDLPAATAIAGLDS